MYMTEAGLSKAVTFNWYVDNESHHSRTAKTQPLYRSRKYITLNTKNRAARITSRFSLHISRRTEWPSPTIDQHSRAPSNRLRRGLRWRLLHLRRTVLLTRHRHPILPPVPFLVDPMGFP